MPELVFVMFQMTFACITPALIVGAFAERVKFTSLIIFVVAVADARLFPDRAHGVVLGRSGLPALTAPTDMGLLWGMGRARLRWRHRGAHQRGYRWSRRLPDRRPAHRLQALRPMPPHSLVMTMIGASPAVDRLVRLQRRLNLESNAFAALAFINTFVATAAAGVAWADDRTDHPQEALAPRRSFGCGGRPRGDHAGGGLCPSRCTAIILGAVASVGLLLLRHHGEEQAGL
jgi:ammonium transporter, Amt family